MGRGRRAEAGGRADGQKGGWADRRAGGRRSDRKADNEYKIL